MIVHSVVAGSVVVADWHWRRFSESSHLAAQDLCLKIHQVKTEDSAMQLVLAADFLPVDQQQLLVH